MLFKEYRLLLLGVSLILFSCNQPKPKIALKENDPGVIHLLNDKLSETVLFDGFSPPVISRIMAYTSVAAYEAAIEGDTNFISYKNQLNGFSGVAPFNGKQKYIPEVALIRAFCRSGVYFTYRDYMLDTIEYELLDGLRNKYNKEDVLASMAYGDSIAAAVIAWAAKDGYAETRKMPYYVLKKKEWSWELTPSQFMEAVEPYWGLVRPFVMDSSSQFRPSGPPPFSTDKNSVFYKEAIKVYEAKGKLMMDDTSSANFWDCNPFVLKREGHVSVFKRQISPGAHWMGITQTACKLRQCGLKESCELYSQTAIVLADAFISCWEGKYQYDLLRPVTYINRYIDPKWKPLLETPPFPEYTSGHSVISSATAVVLEGYLGNKFSYTDSVEIPFGKAPRTFSSFKQAAQEAALSRLYGGIHYMFAIEDGQKQGEQIGNFQLQKIKTSKKKPLAVNTSI